MPDPSSPSGSDHLRLELDILASEIEDDVPHEQDRTEPPVPAPTLEPASTRA